MEIQLRSLILLSAFILFSGCAKNETLENGKKEVLGVTFKGGKGLHIADETKKIIGLELSEASEQKLSPAFSTTVQIYRHSPDQTEATGSILP